MPIVFPDPQNELLDRYREIVTRQHAVMDEQERKEREEAARAYSQENEKHFVDYLNDCVKTSVESKRDIREIQSLCWKIYNEEEPASYNNKASWQSRIVVPKPFESVQYGAACVKKAFSPDYLSVKDTQNKDAADFWKRVLEAYLNDQHSNFILKFTDAVTMALAVGESMEMIPRFVPGSGLVFDLVEPWKIHRDPDAPPRDSQGGMYWIHQEWLDYYLLKERESSGRYFDVARVKDFQTEDPQNPFMTKEAIAERKKQIWTRASFRTMVLVSEFWGIVLSPKGETLLPSATYTVAGGRVIQKPSAVRYGRLRWPGISFSPLPDLLTFGGRGLLKGIMSVWEAMCNLMCLHEDALKWIVNPPTEINVDALIDPEDVEDWPGKKYLVRDTISGQQAVRAVNRRDNTNSILANMQYHEQLFQHGSFITDTVQGLPGYRQDMTARESAQNLTQALGVFSLMGSNVEAGAVAALAAAQDTIQTFAGYKDYADVLGPEILAEYGVQEEQIQANGLPIVPEMSGAFHVSGIQALLKDEETLGNLKSTVIPLATNPRFAPYVRPYYVIKALETRINLTDENVFVDEETAQGLEEAERMQAAMVEEEKGVSDGSEY